jgi:hypothetical protein
MRVDDGYCRNGGCEGGYEAGVARARTRSSHIEGGQAAPDFIERELWRFVFTVWEGSATRTDRIRVRQAPTGDNPSVGTRPCDWSLDASITSHLRCHTSYPSHSFTPPLFEPSPAWDLLILDRLRLSLAPHLAVSVRPSPHML